MVVNWDIAKSINYLLYLCYILAFCYNSRFAVFVLQCLRDFELQRWAGIIFTLFVTSALVGQCTPTFACTFLVLL